MKSSRRLADRQSDEREEGVGARSSSSRNAKNVQTKGQKRSVKVEDEAEAAARRKQENKSRFNFV